MNENIARYKPLIYLIKCALNGTKPETSALADADFDELERLGAFHSVSAMAGCALMTADAEGLMSEATLTKWRDRCHSSLRRMMLLKHETDRVCAALTDSGIRCARLKGIVVSRLFPKPMMREMTDVDILIDNSKMKQARAVMERLGYEPEAVELSNHDVYVKPPIFCFEIHEELFSRYHEKLFSCFIDCRDRMLPCESLPDELRFSDDDLFLYQMAHICKHLHDSGIGLRALTDIYVCSGKLKTDREYIDRGLEKMGIAGDAAVLSRLAEKLFSDPEDPEPMPLTGEEENVLCFLLDSGANGTLEQSIKNRMPQSIYTGVHDIAKLRRRYIRERIWQNPEAYKKAYPFFYRHKAARPLLPVVRLGNAVLHKRDALKSELSSVRRISRKKNK